MFLLSLHEDDGRLTYSTAASGATPESGSTTIGTWFKRIHDIFLVTAATIVAKNSSNSGNSIRRIAVVVVLLVSMQIDGIWWQNKRCDESSQVKSIEER